ncbi:hypothetical protein EVAR_77319_1 [Eumeta japonica]|uniref:Uncharacterized protein n=1 Tax=Eumeta variegata TaxID=151549 RepID=A0A4C2AAH7_EUMVA|nr:hypothetical protein EVAR_77319_1 [Eumeta japonica]
MIGSTVPKIFDYIVDNLQSGSWRSPAMNKRIKINRVALGDCRVRRRSSHSWLMAGEAETDLLRPPIPAPPARPPLLSGLGRQSSA